MAQHVALESYRKHFELLERAVEEAKLEVPIAARFPFAQAAKAHERTERGHAVGRVVLRIRHEES